MLLEFIDFFCEDRERERERERASERTKECPNFREC